MKNEIKIGDVVQCNDLWYGRVIDIARTKDGQVIAYRVQSLDTITAPTLTPNPNESWVDSDKVVLYTALRAAFGPIGYIEKALVNNV